MSHYEIGWSWKRTMKYLSNFIDKTVGHDKLVRCLFIFILFIYFTFHRSSGIKPLRYRNSHIQTRYIKYVVNTLTSIQPS